MNFFLNCKSNQVTHAQDLRGLAVPPDIQSAPFRLAEAPSTGVCQSLESRRLCDPSSKSMSSVAQFLFSKNGMEEPTHKVAVAVGQRAHVRATWLCT